MVDQCSQPERQIVIRICQPPQGVIKHHRVKEARPVQHRAATHWQHQHLPVTAGDLSPELVSKRHDAATSASSSSRPRRRSGRRSGSGSSSSSRTQTQSQAAHCASDDTLSSTLPVTPHELLQICRCHTNVIIHRQHRHIARPHLSEQREELAMRTQCAVCLHDGDSDSNSRDRGVGCIGMY